MCFLFGPPFICLQSDDAVAVHDADNEVKYTFPHSLFIHIKVMSYNRTSSTTRQADRPTDQLTDGLPKRTCYYYYYY